MKVLFLTKYDEHGASSRYRTIQMLPRLEQAGIVGDLCPLLNADYLFRRYGGSRAAKMNVARAMLTRVRKLRRSSSYDLIWSEKEFLPWVPHLLELMIWPRDIPVVLDYDDAIHHRYDNHQSAIVRGALGSKIPRLMSKAACVIVGNDYLERVARGAGASRVVQVPTVVDLSSYTPKSDYQAEVLRVCWVGSPMTSHYLGQINGPLARLAGERAVELLVIGSPLTTMPGVRVRHAQWSQETEAELIRSCDVGIMPLPDSPFERGKCGLKLIQYMAAGLPVIGSPVGVNTKIVEDGQNGLLAESEEEWYEALHRLEGSQKLRAELGRAGRERVERSYSIDAVMPALVEALNEARSTRARDTMWR